VLDQNIHQIWIGGIKLVSEIIFFFIIKFEVLFVKHDFEEDILDIFLANCFWHLTYDVFSKLRKFLCYNILSKLIAVYEFLEQFLILIIHFLSFLCNHCLLLICKLILKEEHEDFFSLVHQLFEQAALIFTLVPAIHSVVVLHEIKMSFKNGMDILVFVLNQHHQHCKTINSELLLQIFLSNYFLEILYSVKHGHLLDLLNLLLLLLIV
jgi:hypothetical protein